MKIATWNVNSLRVRLPHVLQWLAGVQPDVLALQETKIIDEDFPLNEINQAGYQCVFSGQRTYNGVAILAKKTCETVITELPILQDPQKRVLGIMIDDVKILNLYIPNGESLLSEKYAYKLNWLKHLNDYLKQELAGNKQAKFVILGDFNIAPEDVDVHDPAAWAGKVLVSESERKAFREILEIGFSDCFRLHPQDAKSFSWWDYRMNAFKRNMGMRIDHILASEAFAKNCRRCYIDKTPRGLERPSDHTPVVAEFEM